PALPAWHVERVLDLAGGQAGVLQGSAGLPDVVEVEIEENGLLGGIDRAIGRPDHQLGLLALQPCPHGRGLPVQHRIRSPETEVGVELDTALDAGDVRECNERSCRASYVPSRRQDPTRRAAFTPTRSSPAACR